MPQINIQEHTNVDDIIKSLKEHKSKEQMGFDPIMHKWEINERFEINHRSINRHDRKRIKAKYRKKRRK